jgi:hypothetical protein
MKTISKLVLKKLEEVDRLDDEKYRLEKLEEEKLEELNNLTDLLFLDEESVKELEELNKEDENGLIIEDTLLHLDCVLSRRERKCYCDC